jgi:inorganic pyrophosphatase
VPQAVVHRLSHYFETYKTAPGATTKPIEISHTFGRDEAHEVIRAARLDYAERFGALQDQLSHALA